MAGKKKQVKPAPKKEAKKGLKQTKKVDEPKVMTAPPEKV
jgi:outer membrane biosynthesis protein TonB